MSFGRSFSLAALEVGDAGVDMDPVGADPSGDARIVLDKRRGAAGLRPRDDGLGKALQAVAFAGNDHGGYVAAGERIVDERREVIGVNVVRSHQTQATTTHFHFGHHLSAADLPAARGLTREGSPTIAPASPSSRRANIQRIRAFAGRHAAFFSRSGFQSPVAARLFICARWLKARCAAATFSAFPAQVSIAAA